MAERRRHTVGHSLSQPFSGRGLRVKRKSHLWMPIFLNPTHNTSTHCQSIGIPKDNEDNSEARIISGRDGFSPGPSRGTC